MARLAFMYGSSVRAELDINSTYKNPERKLNNDVQQEPVSGVVSVITDETITPATLVVTVAVYGRTQVELADSAAFIIEGAWSAYAFYDRTRFLTIVRTVRIGEITYGTGGLSCRFTVECQLSDPIWRSFIGEAGRRLVP